MVQTRRHFDRRDLKWVHNGDLHTVTNPCCPRDAKRTPQNGFWFINDCLVVPECMGLQESLFHMTYDSLGHFCTAKTYSSLCDSFYRLNVRQDLEEGYIQGCAKCQRNKSHTTKMIGPLHLLPVPDGCCDSIAMDFMGPLPKDSEYNAILTITDHLGSNIRLIPTVITLTTEDLAELFFANWYCKNGLLLDIVSDHNKLFLACFWKQLHKLTNIKLKMSSAHHPKLDGSSKHTNKTVIQCIRFAVEWDQRGWVHALPKICFNIMNERGQHINRVHAFPAVLWKIALCIVPHYPITNTK
jgi:hypothetical protein